ncbi:MAG TPA: glycosyltransferase family 4 protein [Chitinophagaceae bacterium]|nr:glycosyltransferase family 4 protein [Chitinophagaceae bacterium]
MPRIIRITTAPISLKLLLKGQMKFMRENGFDVVMVSSEGKEWEEVIATEGCRHAIIPMTRRLTPFADLRSLWRLYRFIRKEKPDIVHSHTPKAGLLGMLAAKFAGVKVRIHTIAGLRFMTSKGFTRKLLVSMEKLTARAATHVWPNSFSLQQYIIEHKLAKKTKLELIGLGSSNGINLSRFSANAIDPAILQKIKSSVNYDENLVYFLSVGRIVHDKGIDELVSAFTRINEKNANTRLILVGEYEDEVDPVNEKTKEILKNHPSVIMTGWSDQVEYFMQFSFALIHASHREGFPNVLLQAGAMLCPIICSRIEGNIDIVDNDETGLVFDVNNADQLFEKMSYAIANPGQAAACAQTLRAKIETHFDQAVLHQALLRRYRETLD